MVHPLAARVLLRPADFDASVGFYEQVLGLVRAREFGAPPGRGVVYFCGGAELELTETPPGQDPGPRPQGVRLWLRVADAAESCEQLARRGAVVVEHAEPKPWGLIEGRVADPDGLELVVVEVPPDHPMRRDTRQPG